MRIIHISDLHFGMHNPLIIESFLKDMKELKPDIIIISGDLTQRAHSHQYKQFSDFLQHINAQTLIIPGNHDIPFYNAYYRFLYPFKKYKKYISEKLETNFSNEEVSILGVNSATPYLAKNGILSQKTLRHIQNHFSEKSKKLNILFFHHNLHYFSGMHHPLKNAEEFLTYLKDSPIHIVCTGHLHYANVTSITKNQGDQCLLLHGGSAFCFRTKDGKNSYYSINTSHSRCSIDWRVFVDNSFLSHKIYEFDLIL
ncbi:3',5'-cyclic-nucleotide phosphodiesterase [Legionella wadsworthii]|uniref:3',5'-cyclic-nucleotide phosphodiesterase n=1 Tax=Legionella wadsworthii TaxID=28088 RepID=A0A378LUK2_9GAMM|nr:metallophosphoesterase [Legionella wadsworthii]STY29499.1 3',5'-cyclic-nucleotide phosphodiesterase [Legionella wadsworthii]